MNHGGYGGLRALCVLSVLAVALGSAERSWAEEPAQPAPAAPAAQPGEKDKAQPDAKKAGDEGKAPKPAAPTPAPPQADPPKGRPLPGQIQMRGGAVPLIRGRVAIGQPNVGDDDPIFFPADRATLQRLSKAQELLEEKRFGEAVRLLGDILEAPEDYFFQPKRDEPIHRSLKAEAQRLIGELPAEGREAYELLFGEMARQKPRSRRGQRRYVGTDRSVAPLFPYPCRLRSYVFARCSADRPWSAAGRRAVTEAAAKHTGRRDLRTDAVGETGRLLVAGRHGRQRRAKPSPACCSRIALAG